jgi:hypothetical protein
MAYTTIDDPSAHFQTALYTGNLTSGTAITNDGNSDLQPDICWIKTRSSSTYNHVFTDSSRGSTQVLVTQGTNADANVTNSVTSYNTDGFTLGDWAHVNYTGVTYAAWQWKANGGSTSSNTDGTITSTVQANTDAGISIGNFTGNGTSGATVGHGLGVKPDMLILKSRNNPSGAAMYWILGHVGLDGMAGTKNLFMNENWTVNTESVIWANTAPTSSVFSVGTNAAVNYTNNDMMFYAFASKQGFSKFGKYVGNGSTTNGPFVYTGFKPAFVMIKATDAAKNWTIFDNKRYYNGSMYFLYANDIAAEGESPSSGAHIDLLSNGFKIYDNWTLTNQNTVNYIYMAFAENPFVTSTGIPTTAR